jgi:hypothetical protein
MNNYIAQAIFKMLDDVGIKTVKNKKGEYVSEYFMIKNNKFKIIINTDGYIYAMNEIDIVLSELFLFDLLQGKMKIEKIPKPKSNDILYVLQHCKQCESCKKCTLDPCGYKHILKFSTKRLDEMERIIKEYNELMDHINRS